MKKIFLIMGIIVLLFCATAQINAVTTNCTDTDIAQDLFTRGTVSYIFNGQNKSATDYCPDSSKLTEYYCSSGSAYGVTKTCANECSNGVCTSDSSTTACTDSDVTSTYSNGKNYYTKGDVTDIFGLTYNDYCVSSGPETGKLVERFCNGGNANFEYYSCANGCEAGACRTSTTTCTPDYSSCTAWSACSGGQKTQTCTQTNCPSLNATITNTESCSVSGVCTDSDGGRDAFVLGNVLFNGSSFWDQCTGTGGNNVLENFCDLNNARSTEIISCSGICEAGVCVATTTTCTPNWICGAWSACSGGRKIQFCTQSNCPSQQATQTNQEYCGSGGCMDSDGGEVYITRGTMTVGTRSHTDYCNTSNSNYLYEYYCDANGAARLKSNYLCPLGCEAGACRTATCTPNWTCIDTSACVGGSKTQTCTQSNCPSQNLTETRTQNCTVSGPCFDTDGGRIYGTVGTTIGNSNITNVDTCRDSSWLDEYYCDGAVARVEPNYCNNGCELGICKSAITTTTTTCTPNYSSCGAWSACSGGQKTQTCTQTNCPSLNATITNTESCSVSGVCTDSDGGHIYETRGTTADQDEYSTDFCETSGYNIGKLKEYFCTGDQLNFEYYTCSAGCNAGACNAVCTPNYNNCGVWSACISGQRTQTCTQSNCPSLNATITNTESCSVIGTTLPSVDVKINNLDGPVTLAIGSTATLSWTSQNATSCGGSTAPSALSGSSTITVISGRRTYTARCANSAGSDTDEVTVIGIAIPTTISGVCTDSDGGEIYSVRGTITKNGTSSTDFCSYDYQLTEYYCSNTNSVMTALATCDYGCSNGICNPAVVTCTPNYSSCTAWSACSGGQKTRTCTQNNCPSQLSTRTEIDTCTTTTTCTDSDGRNYYTMGFVVDQNNQSSTDSCSGNNLTEYYCDSANNIRSESFYCHNGCSSGACIATTGCADSDSGRIYGTRGTTIDEDETFTDSCRIPTIIGSHLNLTEYFCTGDYLTFEYYSCEYGCSDGICNPTATCTPIYSACGSWGTCLNSSQSRTCTQSNCPLLTLTRTETQPCATCTDTDAGFDVFSRGDLTYISASGISQTWTDVCIDNNNLTEYYCDVSGRYNYRSLNIQCQNGCYDGICVVPTCTPSWTCGSWSSACSGGQKTRTCTQTNCSSIGFSRTEYQPCTTSTTCTDSDSGRSYFVRGTLSYGNRAYTDYCDSNKIIEYYCDANGIGKIDSNYLCAKGCDSANRACRQ